MYRPAYGPPIRGFIFGSPIYVFFLKKTQRSVLFFYIRIGTPGPTYVSLLTILYIFKLFYMLLYIIFIVIIYLTDTYICKKTISHILLTYKNNFLTNKILDCFGTKILVIVYKSLVRFKDECNNITYYLNICITKCSAPFYFLITLMRPPQHYNQNKPNKIMYFEKVQMACNFLGNKINGLHGRYNICSPSSANGCNSKKRSN